MAEAPDPETTYHDHSADQTELKCRVENMGAEGAELNQPVEFSLQFTDSHGRAVESPSSRAVEVRVSSLVGLSPSLDGSVSWATVCTASNGTLKATYTPRNRGRHSISVHLNGREVAGSSFTMYVRIPPSQLKKPVKRFYGVENPRGIAISKNGEVIVAESSLGGEVIVFNKQGKKVKAIKHPSVKMPCGVSTDPDGHIYVSSSKPPTVVKLSQDGQTLLVHAKIKSHGDFLGMLRVIDGRLFVCSNSDCAVIVLDCSNLQEISRFGKKGSGYGEFNGPGDVVAAKGELYVGDYLNRRIQVFSMEGHFIRSINLRERYSYSPRGLCIGLDGLLYVACYGPDRIFAFTLAGECVASIEAVSWPAGIAADTDGFLYVCMSASNAIEVF